MANSDKNILITPSVGLSTNPTIKFNGANNTPTTLRVLDDGTVSFEGTAGQLFSISDGLTGSIFSVNDISGIPSIEVLDTGLVKLNQYGGSAVFGSSAAIQNASSVNAKVSISTASATTPGLIIKGVSSQSANLQEWQDSTGTANSWITASGSTLAFTLNAGWNINWGNTSILSMTSAGLVVNPYSASRQALVIKGAASQTANLQEWQNSAGTVLAAVSSIGTIRSSIFANLTGGLTYIATNFDTSGIGIVTSSAAQKGLIIRGSASQTANLQEWQNDAGTALTKIDNNAGFYAQYIEAKNTAGVLVSGESQIKIASPDGLKDIRFWNRNDAGGLYYYNSSGGSKNILRIAHSTDPRIVTQAWQDFTSSNSANYGGRVNIDTSITTAIGMVIRGAASQTANLQEWQNSAGTVLAKVDAYGYVISNGAVLPSGAGSFETAYGGAFMGMKKTTATVANPVADVARMYFVDGTTAGTLKLVVKAGASGAETTILDNIPQS